MLHKVSQIDHYPVFLLDKNTAEAYKEKITSIWNLIPLSSHAVDDILQETSGSSHYYGKWEHSLIVLDAANKEVIAFITGYERQAEENDEYPRDSIHLKSVSVSDSYQKQGIGRKLVQIWLDFNKRQGFRHLSGELLFSVQTNSADWNAHVQKFYESFGFKKTGEKVYKDKVDSIYFLEDITNTPTHSAP